MKLKGMPQWYVDWDKELRLYCVRKDGFTDSTHDSIYECLKRISKLHEIELQETLLNG